MMCLAFLRDLFFIKDFYVLLEIIYIDWLILFCCSVSLDIKLSNAIIITVMLSAVYFLSDKHIIFFMTYPHKSCTFVYGITFLAFHILFTDNSLLTVSKIPSLARSIKSWFFLISKLIISGYAITTFGFPPNYGILASASPNVLDTDSLPGNTLKGPIKS